MIALRVVDANIIISAALIPEELRRTVLLLALTKPARLYVSSVIVEEYRTVPSRPEFQIRKGLRHELLQLIENNARFVAPVRHLQVTSDPDDNMFVECADVAGGDYLITGNTRHFPRYWKRSKVITSREFLGLVTPRLLS